MTNPSIEKGAAASPEKSERPLIAVAQPKKLEGLLDTINLLNTVSERIGEATGENWSGSGSSTGGQATGQSQQTWRDEAIANLPATAVMQRELQSHINKEIDALQHEVKKLTGRGARPGVGHKLTTIYARIRRLNGILQQLVDASVEVLKRLYIRVFVDKQSAF